MFVLDWTRRARLALAWLQPLRRMMLRSVVFTPEGVWPVAARFRSSLPIATRIHGERGRASGAHSHRISRSPGAAAARRSRRHDCDVRLGAHPARAIAPWPISSVSKRRARQATPQHRAALREARAASGNVPLLRRGSRTVASPHRLGLDVRRPRRAASWSAPAAARASWRRPIAAPREAGGKSIGLSIELPHEQWPNPYISPELSFQFHYFFMRKLWFAQLAKALIVFPGGFGTMDELWEMLTLMQTGKLQRRNPDSDLWPPLLGPRAQLARDAALRHHQSRTNTACCNLPIPWTKPSTAFAAASRNSTWGPTRCSWNRTCFPAQVFRPASPLSRTLPQHLRPRDGI